MMEALFPELRSLDLPPGEFAIFGSGPLIVRGIVLAANDLDIICRGAVWDRVKSIGTVEYLEEYDITVVTMCDGRLSFGTEWGIGEFDVDNLIDNAE